MREATAADVPPLVAMMAEFYAEDDFPLNRERASAAFAALLADPRLGAVWIIEADGADAGYLVLTCCHSMEYGGPIAFVDDFYVRRELRGAGLGSAALAAARDWCAQHGLRALRVETGHDNAAAQTVYRRAGFASTDRQLLMLSLAPPTHVA